MHLFKPTSSGTGKNMPGLCAPTPEESMRSYLQPNTKKLLQVSAGV